MIKYPNRSSLKEALFCSEFEFIIVVKSKQKEMETDMYKMSTVKRKRAMDASVQLNFSSLCSSDLNPVHSAAHF